MRGIEFSKCKSYRNLFRGFCEGKYDWYIYDDEIVTQQIQKKVNGYISFQEFDGLLLDSELLIVFMTLQAFPKGKKARKINDYNDFISSSCSFVVLVTDSDYFEIYTKNDEDFLQFIRNAEICGGTNIRIKTDAEDARSGFTI